MTNPHTYSHSGSQDCACVHDSFSIARRWGLSVLIIVVLLMLLRPFIVSQMLIRVTSYSTAASFGDVIRIGKKIIAIDKANIPAWTALGYAYTDLKQEDLGVAVFERVLKLDPENKGAACFELGKAYYVKGDFTKAIGYFERVRSAGPRAGESLEADILKYRHGTLGFRSLNSMQSLLGMLAICYQKTGNTPKAALIQREYGVYKKSHSKIFF